MNKTICKSAVAACFAVAVSLLAANPALAVDDGEVIAWFPLDGDFLSSVNVEGNPASIPTYIPEGGATNFVSYADSRPILDASGNVVRESKYVTMDKSRVYIPLSGFDLGSDVTGVTFEMFVRGDGRGANSVAEVKQWDEVFWIDEPSGVNAQKKYGKKTASRIFWLQDADGDAGKAYMRVGTDNASALDTNQTWFDGSWHHAAVTIEGTTAKIYKDYALVKTFTLPAAWCGSSSLYLTLGSFGGTSKLDFDEIRITKGVLQPTQFLCFNAKPDPQDGDALLYMPFDGDMTSRAGLYDEFGAATTGTPVYDSAVWKDYVCEFGNTDVLVRRGKNASALKVDKAVVTKTIRNPYLRTNSLDSATVEVFIKGPSDAADISAWGECMHFGKAWYIGSKDSYGLQIMAYSDKKYWFCADTDEENYGVSALKTNIAIADGKWHHFALTVEPAANGTKTKFTWYFDYDSVGSATKNGTWVWMRERGDLSFGAADNVLSFDEFRITKGVLPKAKFLRARSEAATTICIR